MHITGLDTMRIERWMEDLVLFEMKQTLGDYRFKYKYFLLLISQLRDMWHDITGNFSEAYILVVYTDSRYIKRYLTNEQNVNQHHSLPFFPN